MRLVRVLDRQRARCVERRLLGRLARGLLGQLLGRRDFELGVHLIGAAEMTRLNAAFLGHKGSTDVITFNHQENAAAAKLYGEIFISVEDALKQARRFGVRWPWEIARYLVHGALHLEGWDDTEPVSRRAMKRQENKLLKELSRRFDLGKLEKQWR
jgi:probable rRNA maturation factor